MGRIVLLFLALLGASAWLWQKTRLPDVQPLSGEELREALTSESRGDGSLSAAMETAVQVLATPAPEPGHATEASAVLSESVFKALPDSVQAVIQEHTGDPAMIAQTIASQVEVISKENPSAAAAVQADLLESASSILANATPAARTEMEAILSQAAMRVLEIPSGTAPQADELRALRSAVELLKHTQGDDPARLAATLSRVRELHPSPEVQELLRTDASQ